MSEAQRENACDALTVYYDGACPLCRMEISHYRKQEGAERIAFVDVAQAQDAPGPDLTREAALARFHVRGADGALVSGAALALGGAARRTAGRPVAAGARLSRLSAAAPFHCARNARQQANRTAAATSGVMG